MINNDVAGPAWPVHADDRDHRRCARGSGTGANDIFTLRRTGGDDVILSINATSRQFDMDDFTGIRLEGLAGMDLFKLVDPVVTSTLNRNVTVLGGNGHDAVDYSMRGGAMSFIGLRSPDSATAFSYISAITGSAHGPSCLDVEQIRGTQAGDTFDINDAGSVGQNIPMSSAAAVERHVHQRRGAAAHVHRRHGERPVPHRGRLAGGVRRRGQ